LNATWYKTVAIYDWVSTDKQTVDMQLGELRELKSTKELLEKDLKRRRKFNEEISDQP
jgi:hypothetical protein